MQSAPETYVVLSGGVGGSRFLRGLLDHLAPAEVTAVVNTADDIEMYGLHVSPDVDINLYALTGRVDEERMWGRANESWTVQQTLQRDFGLTPWFNLGDQDLAAHLYRTQRLRAGATLSEVTAEMAQRLGVRCHIMPMSDQRMETHLLTNQGKMHFQEYLIKHRCEPQIKEVIFEGLPLAQPAPGLIDRLKRARAVLIPPSNPVVSVGPILALPGVREVLAKRSCPVVAISPIIGGKTVKGPLDRMLVDLGYPSSAGGVAQWYGGLLDGYLVDEADAGLNIPGLETVVCNTWMTDRARRRALAAKTVALADSLRAKH